MLKKISTFFKKSDNDWLNVTVSIAFSIVMIIFLSKTVLNSYALPTELPDTLTTGMGDVLTDRVSLFNELDGEEIISLVPYYATDDSGTRYTVYCLEKDKGWPSNDSPQTITKSDDPLDAGYVYILQNAYPNKSLTGDDKNDDYLTQVAIWFYQDRVNGVSDNSNGVLTANQKSVIKNSSYYKVIEPLLEGAVNAKNNPPTINPSFSISSNDFKLSNDNRYLVTDLITVNSNVTFNDYIVSINNSAVEILDSNDNVINGTTIQYGNGFKLRVDLSKINKPITVDISVIANYTEYQAYSYNPPSNMTDSMQQSVVGTLIGVAKQKTVSANVSMPSGSLTIRKVDSSNNDSRLEGANIEVIRKATNTVVEQFTTTTSDHVISDLLPGEYEIKETSAPSGYYIDKASTNVVITNSNLNVTSTISNSKFTVMIRKIDANTNSPISGAILNILNSDNELMDTITIDSDYVSLDTSKYKEGTYKVVEVQAPDGYLLSDEEVEFTINKDNPNITVNFSNEKNEVLIEKRDSSNNQPVRGATLRLIRVSDNFVIDEWTTTSSAHKISNLARGEYKVIETKAPDGYALSSSEVPITITGEETEPITVTFYNSNNQITIAKVDESGNLLSGAVFRITRDDIEPIVTMTTKDEPYVLTGLTPGTYKIEEIKAPNGYFLNAEPKTFVVDENTTNLQVTLTNTKSYIYIGKIDIDTNQYVGGATLKLSSVDGSYSKEFTSEENPIKVEVPYGNYILEEIEAPKGYVRTKDPLTIYFDEYSSHDYVYQLANQKRRVIISKIDSETKEPLLGSILGLYDSNKDYLYDINLTDVTSTDISSLLGPGTYYIKEKQAPTGYILDNSWHKIEIKDTQDEIILEIENKPLIVNLGKIDAKTGNYIEGAKMRLTGINDFSLELISANEPYQVKLSAGTYTLEEIEAPKGYVGTGSKVTFEVLNTGKVQNINISNDINSIAINNRTLIIKSSADYKYRLEKTTGELIEEFKTTSNGYTIDNLEIGNYILRQVDTPKGILLNEEPLYFSISDTNSLNSINYVNDFTKVYISKKDIANSAEIPGAHLVIIDENDIIVDEWVSTDTPHYIEKLPIGKYILQETIAPNDYVLNTSIIDFEVLETGEIQSEVMFNSKPIEVPNTSRNATYIYLIGGILILIGGSLIYISHVNKTKIKSR